MAKIPPASPDDKERKVADAASLFDDEPKPRKPSVPGLNAPIVDPGETYGIEGGDAGDDEVRMAPVAPVVTPSPQRKSKPKPPTEDEPKIRRPTRPKPTVDQVWSRWAEWGPDLMVLGMAGLGISILIVGLLYSGYWIMAFFLLMAGAAGLIVLSYPLFITLERPIRMTPEQAVNDFYAALSHLRPHYRRMWLLLSSEGRRSGSFSSFEDFRAYWENRVQVLRGGRGGRLTPLMFHVEKYKSEKSAGLTEIDVSFTLSATLEGETSPMATIPMEMDLVKGPDRMWYLNQGTLPLERA